MHILLNRFLVLGLGFWFQTISTQNPIPTNTQIKIIVAADGSGNFKTIQAAIESVKDSTAVYSTVIFIKTGTYREKVFIKKNGLTLRGETKPKNDLNWNAATGVKIIYNQSRDFFRRDNPTDTFSIKHTDDWGASVINIKANDITLENLIVVNDYGFNVKGDRTISVNGKPTVVHKNSHQFALRAMPPCQRLRVNNCNFHAFGGDTVSPWDTDNGSYYFSNCFMEGSVDFYCPRGFAYAENCTFFAHPSDAAIWHDGTGNERAKTVLKNCTFDGDPGFILGRHHRDAQFFLIDCKFSKNLADKPIYQVRKDTALMWGTRANYYNCHRDGGDFSWFANNIDKATAENLTAKNTLSERWENFDKDKTLKADILKEKKDNRADNMITAQRSIGGWAKTLDGKTQPPPYDKIWDATMRASIGDDVGRNDATIDNKATTREIIYLANTFDNTGNEKYRVAAERGIAYLLEMQYQNGGFPQFYPDSSGYRKHITFNDDAMTLALQVLKDVAENKKPFGKVGATFRTKAAKAVEMGIDCILKTQIVQKGKPTIWCAQHDYRTLQPTKARSYELPSFSGEESVKIIEFLIDIEKPTSAIKNAIVNAVAFLESIKITGYKTTRIKDASQKLGEDVVVVADAIAPPIWARFYDLDTRQPFFSGRDGIKKNTLAEIENERRIHYAWYGTWPTDLLYKKYPKWAKVNN